MSGSRRWLPLAWSLGVACGALLAALSSPYVPSWGVALAPPGGLLLFAAGANASLEDELPVMVLRVSVALTIGFVGATVPLTLGWLADVPERSLALEEALGASSSEEARATLTTMWAVMASGIPLGVAGLVLRHRRQTALRAS